MGAAVGAGGVGVGPVEVRGTPEAETGGDEVGSAKGSVVADLVASGTGGPPISASISARSSGDLEDGGRRREGQPLRKR